MTWQAGSAKWGLGFIGGRAAGRPGPRAGPGPPAPPLCGARQVGVLGWFQKGRAPGV